MKFCRIQLSCTRLLYSGYFYCYAMYKISSGFADCSIISKQTTMWGLLQASDLFPSFFQHFFTNMKILQRMAHSLYRHSVYVIVKTCPMCGPSWYNIGKKEETVLTRAVFLVSLTILNLYNSYDVDVSTMKSVSWNRQWYTSCISSMLSICHANLINYCLLKMKPFS